VRPEPARGNQTERDSEDNVPIDDAFDRLIQAFDHHAAHEQEAIAEYRRLVGEFTDPVLMQIMRMLADDEERHHRVFRQIASVLQSERFQSPALASGLPASGLSLGRLDAVIATLRAAMKDEGRGPRALQDLAWRERERCGGLISLLLELMAMDSQKHERMLRYVLEQLQIERRAETRYPDRMG
jgi:rubrerythrin